MLHQVVVPLPSSYGGEGMTVWTCGPVCDGLVRERTPAQEAQLIKAIRLNDHVVACNVVHPGKEL